MKKMKRKNTNSKKYTERLIVPETPQSNLNYLRHMAAYMLGKDFVEDKFVLDDGSGSGYGSSYLINNGAKRVIGIDVAEDTVEYARNRYGFENLEFRTCDATRLSFDDNTFDVVISFQVFEHIRETHKFLQEVVRVLKNSGIALISTPNKRTYSPDTTQPENPFHVKEFYLNEFSELLRNHFDEVNVLGVSRSQRLEEFEKTLNRSLHKRVERLSKKLHISFLKKALPKQLRIYLSKPPKHNIDMSDFKIVDCDLEDCLDFIGICKKI